MIHAKQFSKKKRKLSGFPHSLKHTHTKQCESPDSLACTHRTFNPWRDVGGLRSWNHNYKIVCTLSFVLMNFDYNFCLSNRIKNLIFSCAFHLVNHRHFIVIEKNADYTFLVRSQFYFLHSWNRGRNTFDMTWRSDLIRFLIKEFVNATISHESADNHANKAVVSHS